MYSLNGGISCWATITIKCKLQNENLPARCGFKQEGTESSLQWRLLKEGATQYYFLSLYNTVHIGIFICITYPQHKHPDNKKNLKLPCLKIEWISQTWTTYLIQYYMCLSMYTLNIIVYILFFLFYYYSFYVGIRLYTICIWKITVSSLYVVIV